MFVPDHLALQPAENRRKKWTQKKLALSVDSISEAEKRDGVESKTGNRKPEKPRRGNTLDLTLDPVRGVDHDDGKDDDDDDNDDDGDNRGSEDANKLNIGHRKQLDLNVDAVHVDGAHNDAARSALWDKTRSF